MLCNANISTSLLSYSMSSYTIFVSFSWLLRSSSLYSLTSLLHHHSTLFCPILSPMASPCLSSHLISSPHLSLPRLTSPNVSSPLFALHCTAPSLIQPSSTLPSSPLLSPSCIGQDAHPGQRSSDR